MSITYSEEAEAEDDGIDFLVFLLLLPHPLGIAYLDHLIIAPT